MRCGVVELTHLGQKQLCFGLTNMLKFVTIASGMMAQPQQDSVLGVCVKGGVMESVPRVME